MTSSTAATVAPVHGGLDRPVNRIESGAADTSATKVEVNAVDMTTLYRIADGTLSPLVGPMGRSDFASVLERGAIERGGKQWAWTIPIVLPVTDEEAAACTPGAKIGLWHDGQCFGTLTVSDCFDWDKTEFVTKIYRTERTDHPGARLWTEDSRTKLVGGEITLEPFKDERPFASRVMSPTATRRADPDRHAHRGGCDGLEAEPPVAPRRVGPAFTDADRMERTRETEPGGLQGPRSETGFAPQP